MSINQNKITTDGRECDCEKSKKPFIIGVSGGTSSGKTSVCEKILDLLEETSAVNGSQKVKIINQDNFYKSLTKDEIALADSCEYNFDHPDAFDTKLMKNTLLNLINGKTIRIPEYDFKTHTRKNDVYEEIKRCDVVLFEGILVFYHKEIRDLFDMKLFVDSDSDTRLSRRGVPNNHIVNIAICTVLRDIAERGRSLESVLQQYTTFVKPAFEEFCLPSKKYADVIIPRGAENTVAINLIVQHIRDILNGGTFRRGKSHHSSNGHSLANGFAEGDHVSDELILKKKRSKDSGGRPH